MLTVMLSREAIALFKTHHIGAEELARQAAEWSLLLGRPNNMVKLGLRHEELAAFYWYYYSQSADSPSADSQPA